MRDPVMYRILDEPFIRAPAAKWKIYPDVRFRPRAVGFDRRGSPIRYARLEYEDHRPLYDWYLDNIEIFHPQQIEFARLNLSHTVLSKRKLIRLVQENLRAWLGRSAHADHLPDLRRRGYTPSAIRANSAKMLGVGKVKGVVALHKLEYHIRQDLNKTAQSCHGGAESSEGRYRKLSRTNLVEAIGGDKQPGRRFAPELVRVPFSKVLYIEREDFMEDPPRKFFRLAPGREVRLRYAYFITCTDVIKDEHGDRSSSCAAPTIRRHVAERRPMDGG